MTRHPTEAVIAGSKAFALALLAPLAERVGSRPRVAADPSQAAALIGGSGLVVVEFQGDHTLDALRRLVAEATGLAVVAAIPDGQAGAVQALRGLGVEPVRWQGDPDAVVTAVARRLAGAPAVPPAASAGSSVGALFDDLQLDEAGPDATSGADARPAAAPPAGAPPAAAPRAPAAVAGAGWPADVPGAAEAAEALAQGLRGVFPPDGSPLAVVASTMAGMSRLERAVLLGEPQPIDTEPIRRAAVMRVRVAVALATAPQGPGSGDVDAGAVSALLAELDGLLSEVNALLAAAPPELQGPLADVRNALVKEAIDFSEAAHQISSGEPAPATPAASAERAAARRAAGTRVLSVASAAQREAERSASRQQRWAWGLLAAAILGAGAFHGYGWWRAREASRQEPPGRAGAPADAVVSSSGAPGAPIVIQAKGGRPFTAEELQRIGDAEALRGNAVRVVGGAVIVTPGTVRGAPPATPPGGAASAGAEGGERQGATPTAGAR